MPTAHPIRAENSHVTVAAASERSEKKHSMDYKSAIELSEHSEAVLRGYDTGDGDLYLYFTKGHGRRKRLQAYRKVLDRSGSVVNIDAAPTDLDDQGWEPGQVPHGTGVLSPQMSSCRQGTAHIGR